MTADGHFRGLEDEETVGMFVARAWLHDQSLIARVIRTPDLAGAASVTVVVSTPYQLHKELARWLHELGVNASEKPESEDD